MVDFDSLRDCIDDDADLVLFDEAVTCHRGGAHRAAYVFAWIAAAEGLLKKLDTMGASQADIGAFVKKFKAEQDAGSGTDASLLDQAAKAGFVDTTEYKALDGVRALRNQYGHPTATAPTDTAAAAAIELAVDAVLAKPALLQHGGARQLAERIGTDPHYIPNDPDAIAGWTGARAPLIAEAARPLFVRTLVEQHAANLGQIDETLAERCRIAAATVLEAWSPDLAAETWSVDSLLQAHGSSAAAIFGSTGAWVLLSEGDQHGILSRSLEAPAATGDPKLTNRLMSRAFELLVSGALTELQADLVAERVQVLDGTWLVSAGAPIDLLLAKAAGYLNDGSFDENKNGTRMLDAIAKPVLETATDASLIAVATALVRAARQNAFVARNLIGEVVNEPDTWPKPFRISVAVEGAIAPWPFHNEYTATRAMRLCLHDADVARAVQEALAQASKEDGVGFDSRDIVEGTEELIDAAGNGLDDGAVQIVREILEVVETRYQSIYEEAEP